jgi:hypothetical protein
MKQIQAPEFLNNLYRDMRDRRLLLPAAALLVCLIAIPQLLSSSSTTPPPAPTVPVATAGKQTAAEPAVVTEQLGVTNYRKRLEQFKSKNPFRQQFTTPKVTPAASLPGSSSLSTGTTSTTTSTTSTALSPSTTSTTPTTSTPTGATPAPSPTPTTSSTPRPPQSTLTLYTFRLHVRVGTAGHLSDRPQVTRLTALPSKQKPVVTFLFVNERGTAAAFLVSRDIESADGDGRCVPSHTDCQYLIMRPGDNASIVYTPNGETYKLRLIDIHPSVVGHTAPTTQRGKAQRKTAPPDLTSADRFSLIPPG